MSALAGTADVVIVGAGLAGLACARQVAAAGLDVVVLESTDAAGGRIRTDPVDGFLLDRGFQVLNDSYPELARAVDLDALDLKPFLRGALLRVDGRRHRLVDPRQRPGALGSTVTALATAPVGSLADRARLGALVVRAARGDGRRLVDDPDVGTRDLLRARGISTTTIDRLATPFFRGVFLEEDMATSSRFFSLVARTFARGQACLPARGMQSLPQQIADSLPTGTVHLSNPVRAVRSHGVDTEAGTMTARAVVVAVDPVAAGRLVEGVAVPPMRSVTTWYHSPAEAPTDEAIIALDADGGPVASSIVLTNAAPTYGPAGRALVATSVIGPRILGDADLARHLGELWGTSTAGWDLIGRVEVPEALPAALPPLAPRLRRSVEVGGVYVAGDHRDTPSIQGALVSGRRVAEAVVAATG